MTLRRGDRIHEKKTGRQGTLVDIVSEIRADSGLGPPTQIPPRAYVRWDEGLADWADVGAIEPAERREATA